MEILIVYVSNSTLDSVLFMNQVTSGLLNEETRRKIIGINNTQVLLLRKGKGVRVRDQSVVLTGLEFDHRLRKGLESSTFTIRDTLRCIAFL